MGVKRATDEQLQDIIDGCPQKMAMYELIAEELQERREMKCGICTWWEQKDDATGTCHYPSMRAFPLLEVPARWFCADFHKREE
jgi:hypothetical protein